MHEPSAAFDRSVEAPPTEQPTTPAERYWDANLRLIATLLAIWFAVAYLPVLIVLPLNQLTIFTGFPLGYYMASQGALIAFVVLIVYYAWRLTRMDARYNAAATPRNADPDARLSTFDS